MRRLDAQRLRRLMRIRTGIGERVGTAVEHGIKERLYSQHVIFPGMNSDNGDLVKVLRPKWRPVTGPVQNDLLDTVRKCRSSTSRP